MYNLVTENKIKSIPKIGKIETDVLPQELSRIYAQIITLKRQFKAGEIDFNQSELIESLNLLNTLASNLETLLATQFDERLKESIAFVAATAYNLIYLINESKFNTPDLGVNTDSISPIISAIVLFLIGNSQADAAEMANKLRIADVSNTTQKKLCTYIQFLAKGNPSEILNSPFSEEDVIDPNIQNFALNLLYKEIGIGIYSIAEKLIGKGELTITDSFDKVVDLSVSKIKDQNQNSIFLGPYHLAKLLRTLQQDLLKRAIINIQPPNEIKHRIWNKFIKSLAKERPYLWENHMDALNTNFLKLGSSSVLTLPTGAGKSTLAELKIASCLFSGKYVIYLVPTHALEDQVNNSLMKLFKSIKFEFLEFDKEFTEFDEVSSNPIQVMTPERCLTLLNLDSDFFNNVGLVVFDEFHLIHGKDIYRDNRSIDAMFCLISLFTKIPNADYLLVSAMVQNGEEISEWIANITGRECLLFNSSWKPTRQLHGCLVFQDDEISELQEKLTFEKNHGKTKGVPSKLKKNLNAKPFCLFSLKNIWESKDSEDYYISNILDKNVLLSSGKFWNLTSNRNQVAAELAIHFTTLGLKTLIFVNNPIVALSTANQISESLEYNPKEFEKFIDTNKKEVESLIYELGDFEYSYFKDGLNVGVHHGLLLPIERNLIEKFFKINNGSKALVATATLAQGINLPAEIVIIAGDDRYNEDLKAMESVLPHELLNAAGRAGRAGHSAQGAVIIIPGSITTINGHSLSSKWWELKDQVFSKTDQCLEIEDPLENFLNLIQDNSIPLDFRQSNILYKFKSDQISEISTRKILGNSFYHFKSKRNSTEDVFENQVVNLLKRRSELDHSSTDIYWTKEISFKSGIDPSIILELGECINKLDFNKFVNLSVIELIEWFIDWVFDKENRLIKIFIKPSTISQINKSVGLKPENENIDMILERKEIFKNILVLYVKGITYSDLNEKIPSKQKNDPFLTKSRNFVLRLVPEVSFSFGLLSMVLIEIANQKGINKKMLPTTIRVLASCVREGVDRVEKLIHKRNNRIIGRVETHLSYKE